MPVRLGLFETIAQGNLQVALAAEQARMQRERLAYGAALGKWRMSTEYQMRLQAESERDKRQADLSLTKMMLSDKLLRSRARLGHELITERDIAGEARLRERGDIERERAESRERDEVSSYWGLFPQLGAWFDENQIAERPTTKAGFAVGVSAFKLSRELKKEETDIDKVMELDAALGESMAKSGADPKTIAVARQLVRTGNVSQALGMLGVVMPARPMTETEKNRELLKLWQWTTTRVAQEYPSTMKDEKGRALPAEDIAEMRQTRQTELYNSGLALLTGAPPPEEILVRHKETGTVGHIPEDRFDPAVYERIEGPLEGTEKGASFWSDILQIGKEVEKRLPPRTTFPLGRTPLIGE